MNNKATTPRYLLRGLAVWCVIIVAESLHGTARELWLKPLVGDLRARQIAFFSGMVLILGVSLLFVRWFRTESPSQLLKIGLLWLVLTVTFEFSLGLLVLGYSWERMWEDYNLLKGGLMGLLDLAAFRALAGVSLTRNQGENLVDGALAARFIEQ